MSPFFALLAVAVGLSVVRLVIQHYRIREIYARYDARVRLAAEAATREDAAPPDGSAASEAETPNAA